VEHWDGTTWSIVPSPKPEHAPFAALVAVSCTARSRCVAVGFDAPTALGPEHILTERWDGKAWSIVAAPAPPASTSAELIGVSCPNARSCVAVGETTTRTLVEHWSGATWSIVSSPTPVAATRVDLAGVSCPDSSTCMAVGRYSTRDSSFTLAELGS
jgi:hypothetical protein